jgi:hypothetical protein
VILVRKIKHTGAKRNPATFTAPPAVHKLRLQGQHLQDNLRRPGGRLDFKSTYQSLITNQDIYQRHAKAPAVVIIALYFIADRAFASVAGGSHNASHQSHYLL